MPNHLGREFSVEAPNKKWVTDITYIPTRQGWCYLAAVVDLYSRKVVGWDVAKTMTAELALRALRLAKVLRQPKDSVLVHSDQGSQYTSGEWRDYAASNGVELSQSRRGNCWDNAVMERFFGSLKSEWVKERCYQDAESAKRTSVNMSSNTTICGDLIPILVVFHQKNMRPPLNGVSTFTRPEDYATTVRLHSRHRTLSDSSEIFSLLTTCI